MKDLERGTGVEADSIDRLEAVGKFMDRRMRLSGKSLDVLRYKGNRWRM